MSNDGLLSKLLELKEKLSSMSNEEIAELVKSIPVSEDEIAQSSIIEQAIMHTETIEDRILKCWKPS